MPAIIRPEVTGTINIQMKLSEAKNLIDSLDVILSISSPSWEGKTLRDLVDGDTCNQFLKALKKVVD